MKNLISKKSDSTNEEGKRLNHSIFQNKLISFLYYIALGLLVFFMLNLWYRWLRIDPEFLNFTTGIAELLTIAAFLGIQTNPVIKSKISFKGLFIDGSIKQQLRKCIIAWIVVTFFFFLLYISSNQIAELFRKNGVSAMEEGKYSKAILNFQQALNLSGGDAKTYYNLASAEESLHNYDQAIVNYHISIELDDSFWPAFNNLGRLYLDATDDTDAALSILLIGYRSAFTELGKSVIGKNIGQAYLQMDLLNASLDELSQAEVSFKELLASNESVEIYLAETHLLKAKVYENLNMFAEAKREWQDSLGFALSISESDLCNLTELKTPPDCLNAIRWETEAREVLAK